MSVAADLVTPSWLQVPKWARATASGQRSAAQNGQDSSLTNTMAGLPFTVSGGPEEATWCSGVATRPGLTWLSTPSGTAATGRATAAGAADSLAVRWAGDLVRLTATSVAAMATTAVTEPSAISIRRRFSARLRAARSAAIRSRALGRRGGRDTAEGQRHQGRGQRQQHRGQRQAARRGPQQLPPQAAERLGRAEQPLEPLQRIGGRHAQLSSTQLSWAGPGGRQPRRAQPGYGGARGQGAPFGQHDQGGG